MHIGVHDVIVFVAIFVGGTIGCQARRIFNKHRAIANK